MKNLSKLLNFLKTPFLGIKKKVEQNGGIINLSEKIGAFIGNLIGLSLKHLIIPLFKLIISILGFILLIIPAIIVDICEELFSLINELLSENKPKNVIYLSDYREQEKVVNFQSLRLGIQYDIEFLFKIKEDFTEAYLDEKYELAKIKFSNFNGKKDIGKHKLGNDYSEEAFDNYLIECDLLYKELKYKFFPDINANRDILDGKYRPLRLHSFRFKPKFYLNQWVKLDTITGRVIEIASCPFDGYSIMDTQGRCYTQIEENKLAEIKDNNNELLLFQGLRTV